MFSCSSCHKQFTSKQNLQYHDIKVDCTKNQCSSCLHIFSSERTYKNHVDKQICLKRKRKIKTETESLTFQQQVYLEELKLKQEEIKLKQLETQTQQLLIKRQKPSTRPESTQNNDNCQVDNVVNTNNTNNTNNTIINQTVNFSHPLPYGQEEVNEILRDPKVINYILSKPNRSIIEMFRKIHCNPDYPQNQTVYMSKRNPKIAMVSDGENYLHRDADDIIRNLFLDNRDRVSDLFDEYRCRLTPYNQQRHETVLSDEEMAKKATNDIRLGLFDIEHKVKKPRLSLKFREVHQPIK